MHNLVAACIYIPFAVVAVTIFVMKLLKRFKHPEDYLFSAMCLIALVWLALNTTSALTSNVALIKLFFTCAVGFVAVAIPILLLFTLKFYRFAHKLSKLGTIALFVIPAATVILVLTSGLHTLIYSQLEITTLSPVREIFVERGVWFWIHSCYSYALLLITIVTIIRRHFSMPKSYRFPSLMMVIGILLSLFGSTLNFTPLIPAAFGATPVSISLALIFFQIAISNNDQNKFIRFSRGQIFNYLNLYILVLGKNYQVLDYNSPAYAWLSSFGINLSSTSLRNVIKTLLQNGATTQKVSKKESGIDIYVPTDTILSVFNLCVHKMADTKGNVIGYIAVFTDVTQNRMLIERLEAKAGMDSLTGLANRMAFEGAKKRLDAAEYLPLSVIMTDMNALKYVNDTFGHQYGDMMIQVVADVLESVCPRFGFVARVGGDEFIFLLPNTTAEAAEEIMHQVSELLARCVKLPFTVSMALGTATKTSTDENIEDVLALADSRMYENKMQVKGRPRILKHPAYSNYNAFDS